MSLEDGQAQQDLTVVVQGLLNDMQGRFQTMSDNIIGRSTSPCLPYLTCLRLTIVFQTALVSHLDHCILRRHSCSLRSYAFFPCIRPLSPTLTSFLSSHSRGLTNVLAALRFASVCCLRSRRHGLAHRRPGEVHRRPHDAGRHRGGEREARHRRRRRRRLFWRLRVRAPTPHCI